MLEEQIEKLADSNEALIEVIKELITKLETGEVTAKPSARTPAEQDEPKAAVKENNVKPLKKEPSKEKPQVTKDGVRKALIEIQKSFGAEAMYAIISDVADGARNMSEVKEEHYQPIVDACEAKNSELAEAA